ncbi:hypothetical protein KSP40_PGU021711 [Platanthera guangdongensis]|uniref:Uncharacterized protein n=1 Tax=Platanthera guangdongensis TaxID=2320717 RepID=A0ABR2N3I6_9ASPA
MSPLSQEVAKNFYVYRNVSSHNVKEFTQILQDVTSNPTLPRTKSVKYIILSSRSCILPGNVFYIQQLVLQE